jgi:hypothetical protein
MFYEDINEEELRKEEQDALPTYQNPEDNYYSSIGDSSNYSLHRVSPEKPAIPQDTQSELIRYFLARGMRRQDAAVQAQKIMSQMGVEKTSADNRHPATMGLSDTALSAGGGGVLGALLSGGGGWKRRAVGTLGGALAGGLVPHNRAAAGAGAGILLGGLHATNAGRTLKHIDNNTISKLQAALGKQLRKVPMEPRASFRESLVGPQGAFKNVQGAVDEINAGISAYAPKGQGGTGAVDYQAIERGLGGGKQIPMLQWLPGLGHEAMGGLRSIPTKNIGGIDKAELEALTKAKEVLGRNLDPAALQGKFEAATKAIKDMPPLRGRAAGSAGEIEGALAHLDNLNLSEGFNSAISGTRSKLTQAEDAMVAAKHRAKVLFNKGRDTPVARQRLLLASQDAETAYRSALSEAQQLTQGLPSQGNRVIDGYLQRAEALKAYHGGVSKELMTAAGKADKAGAPIMAPLFLGLGGGLAGEYATPASEKTSEWSRGPVSALTAALGGVSHHENALFGTDYGSDIASHLKENYPYYLAATAAALPAAHYMFRTPDLEEMRIRGRV